MVILLSGNCWQHVQQQLWKECENRNMWFLVRKKVNPTSVISGIRYFPECFFYHFASSYAGFLLYDELLAWEYKKKLVVSPVLLLEIKCSRATASNPAEVQENKEICWNIALHLLWPPAPVQSWVLNISWLCPLWKSLKRNCRKCRIKQQHLQFKNLLVKWIRMYISTGSEPRLANGSIQLLEWIQQCISV